MARSRTLSSKQIRVLGLQAVLVGCCVVLAVACAVEDWRYELQNAVNHPTNPTTEFRAWLERRAAPFALASALLLLTVNSGWYSARTARRLQHERRRALHDPLTRLPNRRAFDRRLQQIGGDRRGTTSLLFIDLDHFKSLNDTHGHLAGDAALMEVAAAMRAVVSNDEGLCCRWGGDEFAILLPGADRAQAERVAERVAHALDHVCVCVDQQLRVPVRGSIGIATVRDDDRGNGPGRAEDRRQRLLSVADAALADAKRARSTAFG
jgi:diguanylate cyclase (GGDEF)-like protein